MNLERGTNGTFVLNVAPGEYDTKVLVRDHGFDFFSETVFSTSNHYAAMTFAEYASPDLLGEWAPALDQIERSWALQNNEHLRTTHSKSGMEFQPFQRAGVSYVMPLSHALIGDQPGCTKTAMAIAVANEMLAKSVLVICPANIRTQWMRNIRDWSILPGRFTIYPIMKSSDGVHPRAEWTIISYDLTRNEHIVEALTRRHYDLIILDEAHYLKTGTTKRTSRVLGAHGEGLIAHAEKVIALTGTPLPNRPKECWTLSNALCPSAIDYMNEDDFRYRFNPSARVAGQRKDKTLFEYTREETGRLPELQNRLRSNFMVRRLKRQVMPQLPETRYEIQHVEENAAVKKALEAERMLDLDPENLKGVDAKILGQVSTVRLEMGIAKAPQVADYVDMLIAGGEEKIVLFGWHIATLDILEQRLHKHGLVRIDGRTSPVRRQAHVDRFVDDRGIRICLGNLQALGIGVDRIQLVCSHAVFAECSWVPSDNEQGVSRLERMGQQESVLAEFLVAPGSFDERVLGSSLRKLQHIHAALDKEHT